MARVLNLGARRPQGSGFGTERLGWRPALRAADRAPLAGVQPANLLGTEPAPELVTCGAAGRSSWRRSSWAKIGPRSSCPLWGRARRRSLQGVCGRGVRGHVGLCQAPWPHSRSTRGWRWVEAAAAAATSSRDASSFLTRRFIFIFSFFFSQVFIFFFLFLSFLFLYPTHHIHTYPLSNYGYQQHWPIVNRGLRLGTRGHCGGMGWWRAWIPRGQCFWTCT